MSFFNAFNLNLAASGQRIPMRPIPLRPMFNPTSSTMYSAPTSPQASNQAVEFNLESQPDEIVFDSQPAVYNGLVSQASLPAQASPQTTVSEKVVPPTTKRKSRSNIEHVDFVDKPASGRFHWDNRKTVILIEAKKTHDDDKFQAGIAGKSKTMEQQWTSIVTTCATKGLLVDWKTAHDKCQRLSKVHKEIADWERNMPSGRSSYWSMTFAERQVEGRFSHKNFDRDMFDVMERNYGHDPSVDPTATVVDSNADNWASRAHGTPCASNGVSNAQDDSLPFEQTASNGGVPLKKTRKRVHTYDVGLKDATKDMSKVFEVFEEGRSHRHTEVMAFEERKVETGKQIAAGINMMALALAKMADKM